MLNDELPFNDYFEYFKPDYRLHLPAQKNMENFNSTKELQSTLQKFSTQKEISSYSTNGGRNNSDSKAAQDLDEREKIHADAATQRQLLPSKAKKLANTT